MYSTGAIEGYRMAGMFPAMEIQHPAQLTTSRLNQLMGLAFFGAVSWLLYRGWQLRSEHYLTAERGLGYALGIIGGTMMLALLLYPLRKNLRVIRNWGPIRYWFRTHMVFGVLGPALILFHANFKLGSLNSNVALACMLLVASSGIVGRFFYSRIHYGLYGRQASLQELGDIAGYNRGRLAWLSTASEGFISHLQSLEQMALQPTQGVLHSIGRWLRYTLTSWWHRWRLRRLLGAALRKTARNKKWDHRTRRLYRRQAHYYLKTYFEAIHKVLEFKFYERLFALWHVIHLPFFLMMLLSGIVHVVAVHMY